MDALDFTRGSEWDLKIQVSSNKEHCNLQEAMAARLRRMFRMLYERGVRLVLVEAVASVVAISIGVQEGVSVCCGVERETLLYIAMQAAVVLWSPFSDDIGWISCIDCVYYFESLK